MLHLYLEKYKDIRNDLSRIDEIISVYNDSEYCELLSSLNLYISTTQGKKVRSTLLLFIAYGLGNCNNNHILLGAAIECIHTATLLHDDVIDQATIRRKRSTLNFIYNNKISILTGDYVFSKAFKLMADTKSIDAIHELSRITSTLAAAEIMQTEMLSNFSLSKKNYIKLISDKTASLFKISCKISAILSDANKNLIYYSSCYGENFGMAFQIMDDLIDYFGSSELTGKDIGSDFIDGKITKPLILLHDVASVEDQAYLENIMKANSRTIEDFHHILKLMNQYDIYNKTLYYIDELICKCQNIIKDLPNSEYKSALLNIPQNIKKYMENCVTL